MFKKAPALDPNNPDALEEYSNMLAGLGRLKEALAIKQQLLALEPVVPIYNYTSAQLLWLNGQSNAAIAMLKNLTPAFRGGYLPMIYTSMGRFNEAADIIRGAGNSPTAEEAARLLRTAPTTTSSPENLPRLAGDGYIYISVGAPNRALEFEEELVDAGVPYNLRVAKLWHPLWRPARKSERFKAILRKFGYVEYWRARGWPEFCHPTIGD